MITKKFSSREKRIFVFCIIIVFIYAGYNGIFLPIKSKKDQLAAQIASTERKIKKNKRLIRRGKALKAQYDSLLAKFKQETSDEKVMSSILSEIEKIANEVDMRITQMKPQRVKKDDFSNYFSVSLSTDGSLNDILSFLNILQNDAHLFNVDNLKFDKISPRTPNLRCRLVVSKMKIP